MVTDLLADDIYRDSPLAEAGVRFYAGAPLITREGFALGSMCVLGPEPRTATEAELALLQRSRGQMVMDQIELQHAFGRIDAVSGLPNRNQLVEDLEDIARDHPGKESHGGSDRSCRHRGSLPTRSGCWGRPSSTIW